MSRVLRILGGAIGVGAGAVAAWDAWGRFVQADVEHVPYTVVERDGPFEVREYPDVVVARTVAESEREAFRRLFAYIDGANEAGRDVSMTAPVSTTAGVDLAMTAPVSTTPVESGVEMAFFLPSKYTLESAPTPRDDRVELDVVEHRRVAAYRFSWVTTDALVDRARRRLDRALDDHRLEPAGRRELHRYDDPRTPPWQRRNELVVDLA
ncbi:heme-binding protein [Halorubellus sp. JP-L1]|uniref:SOUL family heme-binding protein n=1 Tax=Halorubellus sp. JP-L1 TaxID=2715753 RepID=UPI0014081A80|nr:heme-binding protein [Halorubellus sp. JP-L1]NHN41515.1 heme-binding protein [Halorubellus sp. JP-L1]